MYSEQTFSIMDSTELLNIISKTIHRKDPSAEAYLYGSRARGNNRPDSDWDILILVDDNKFTNEIDEKFRDKLYDIELDAEQIISTTIYPKNFWKDKLQHSPLYGKVQSEGIRL